MWTVEEKVNGKWIVCYSSLGYAQSFKMKKDAIEQKRFSRKDAIAFDDVVLPMRVIEYERKENGKKSSTVRR